MTPWRLIADIGGTNTRFARVNADGEIFDRHNVLTSAYESFYEALASYVAPRGGPSGCTGAAIGAAGPVRDGAVRLTNATWQIDRRQVSASLGGARVRVVNDLQAVAHALPYLSADEVKPIGAGERTAASGAARLAINIGTGFGASALVPSDAGWVSCASEAGHMTLAGTDEDELESLLHGEPAGDSVEDILSGGGVVRLYRRVAELGAASARTVPSAAEVFLEAASDADAARTVRLFTAYLARIVGDLVLATAAWGGVYLTGSVARGWYEVADHALFRNVFERKGQMSQAIRPVPTYLLPSDRHSLVGLSHIA